MTVPGSLTLVYSLAQFRAHKGQYLLAVVAIAVGVALALAIHLVNQSALTEFADALAKVNGQAQLRVVPVGGDTIDETVFEKLLAASLAASDRLPVQALSPIIDLQVQVPPQIKEASQFKGPSQSSSNDRSGPTTSLRVIGLDPFRAALISPAMLPALPPTAAESSSGSGSVLFGDESVFLSAAASQRLGLSVGEQLIVAYGGRSIALRVAGSLPGVSQDQMIAVMDIGTMQWRFDWLGKLSRIDLIWSDAAESIAASPRLQTLLGANAKAVRPELEGEKISNLSRAYRVNLTVLSLVALLTGAYIVFTTMSLAVTRQGRGLALLAVLGMGRAQVEWIVLFQALLLGSAGALAGLVAGIAMASALLRSFGADLGSGYFRGLHPALRIEPLACALFVALGIVIAFLGAWLPARAARVSSLASGLRGYGNAMASRRWLLSASVFAALTGGLLLLLPPIQNLPIPAYAAIALWLIAGIGLSSLLAAGLGALLTRIEAPLSRRLPLWLASNRLATVSATAAGKTAVLGSGSSASTAIAGVVASFALASAMAIMVHSFRESVAVWLDQVLPADLYVRAASAASANVTAALDPQWQMAVALIDGIKRVEFLRVVETTVLDDKPKASVLAKPLNPHQIEQQLPLIGPTRIAPTGTTAVYVSEVASALFGLRPGDRFTLSELAAGETFYVAAIWRDYARQNGAIAIALDDYRRLTADYGINELAIWRRPGASESAIITALTGAMTGVMTGAQSDTLSGAPPNGTQLQWRSAEQLRELSLQIFDRSFVLTYVLEAIAIGVGLLGVAASFAADALSRAREFAVLRYLGLARPRLLQLIGAEAMLLLCVATIAALALGAVIAAVLVFVVNPQSFFWTMEMRVPWTLLATSSLGLIIAGLAAALIGGRAVMAPQLTQAIKDDW